MNNYIICSLQNEGSVTYSILEHPDLLQIFDDRVKNLILNNVSFELGSTALLFARNNLKISIEGYLSERNKSIVNRFPPKDVDLHLFGKILSLNLRNPIDETIFWYGNIFQILDASIKKKGNIKFYFTNGKKQFDIKSKIDLLIL